MTYLVAREYKKADSHPELDILNNFVSFHITYILEAGHGVVLYLRSELFNAR